MPVSVDILQLQPRHEFRISRGSKASVRNVILRIDRDGIVGLGEASPNAFYRETTEDVSRRLTDLSDWLQNIKITAASDIIALWPEIRKRVSPSRAAACAVDLALWDWLAQSQKITLSELVWGEKAQPVTSCVTLGLSDPDELAKKIAEIAEFPLLKIKVGRTGSVELIHLIRQHTSARLVVDANAAWDAATLLQTAPQLAELGVEFIEQPLPPGPLPSLPHGTLPIFADESCVTPEDVDRLPEGFAGFNIKLVKCGGLTPALDMLARGKQRGLQTMVGCMLESSVLIAAAAVIAQKTDYADLDGSWLLQSEPFGRVNFDNGIVTIH